MKSIVVGLFAGIALLAGCSSEAEVPPSRSRRTRRSPRLLLAREISKRIALPGLKRPRVPFEGHRGPVTTIRGRSRDECAYACCHRSLESEDLASCARSRVIPTAKSRAHSAPGSCEERRCHTS